ncbi:MULTISPECIES: helix-turn-helix domain-containing protein [Clostridiaceae]|uniref:HTH cro/C1-type domain-containing protein n=1 Tax=Clostridium facile TaxID=2763035 RepID=A0ABR7IQH3_9CLOT|nr:MULTISPECIES: helix-turn-helix domain-containing protein [Clostridiaceae]MBC5787092.1 hypothetical protein [Clostridium facile]PWM99330.1 MAG: hypothetical protein DBX37_04725 [Massilioclostridium sp.]PWN00367.1 MAG: hypothetical protein DBX37_02095 [Massilioclostridium sp.]
MEQKEQQKLKKIIVTRYGSIQDFSEKNDIPPSVLEKIYKKGAGNLGITTARKLCNSLGIDLDALAEGKVKQRKPRNNRTNFLSQNNP